MKQNVPKLVERVVAPYVYACPSYTSPFQERFADIEYTILKINGILSMLKRASKINQALSKKVKLNFQLKNYHSFLQKGMDRRNLTTCLKCFNKFFQKKTLLSSFESAKKQKFLSVLQEEVSHVLVMHFASEYCLCGAMCVLPKSLLFPLICA